MDAEQPRDFRQSERSSDDRGKTMAIIPILAPFHRLAVPTAYPLIRVAAGALLVPHGAQKLFGLFGGHPEQIADQFEKIGLRPGATFVTLVGTIEFFGGLLLVLGLLTRPVAAVVTGMLATTILVSSSHGWFWFQGGVEYPLLWTLVCFAVCLRGGGDFSLDALVGREF